MEGFEGDGEEEEEGGFRLLIPSVIAGISEGSLPIMAQDKTIVAQFESFCGRWEEEVMRQIDDLPKKAKTYRPLAELELWRLRNSALSSLYAQLESKEVRKVLVVLNEAKSSRAPSFEFTKKEVYWKLQEARDISRFLATIERHLKVLSSSTNFGEMGAALPRILEGLQMIWMLSRHYNKEERMGVMLGMIGRILDERVTSLIHPKVLFLKDPLGALELSEEAKKLFLTWVTTYMATRQSIEQSGKGMRWEFDRTKLFSRTDYDALIAQHLSEISVVLLEFTNFFGPEIKEVIGDSRKVDEALQNAFLLVRPFTQVEFDPFLPSNGKEWADLLETLRKDVRILEAEATSFIEEAFRSVKSAEAAFEMLMKFKHIETRDGIHGQLMKKFEDTLLIYIQEIRNVQEFYELNLDSPTVYKYSPPIGGRVWWVRSIFYHLKRSILRFRSENDVISTKVGQLACQEYLSLAQSMKKYEDSWYQVFCDSAHKALPSIRQSIFKQVPTGKELSAELDISKTKEVYRVNLPSEVMEMVQEALNFEQMGYRISGTVRNIAFQRTQYIRNSRALSNIISHYYTVRRNLRPAETLLMEKSIREMEMNFEQGLNRLNWTGLAIPDYAATLSTAVHKFEDLVNQVNKVAKEIRVHLWIIRKSQLYLEPPYKEGKYSISILECRDFFLYWERYRHRVTEKCLAQFKGLPPLFLKLETLLYGTSTGKLKQFRPYFIGWEKRIFLFMSKFIIRALYDFERRLSLPEPLFVLSATLEGPQIHLSPSPHEIYKMVLGGAEDCVVGSKKFVRWLRGSCTSAPPIPSDVGGTEPFVYSYYLDIGRLPRVTQLLLKTQERIQGILNRIWDHLRKYRKFRSLWRYNKEKTVMGFAGNFPSSQLYDQKMGFYWELAERVQELPSRRLEGGIQLNLEPLHTILTRHGREWVAKLGGALATATRTLSSEFERRVREYENDVFLIPRSMEELRKVLGTIKAIQDSTVEMEGKYQDLLSRYETLSRYHIEVEEDEIRLVEETWKRWQLLWLHEVKMVNKQLEPLKGRFKKLIMQQKVKLKGDVGGFVKRFYAIGPSPLQWDVQNEFQLLRDLQLEFKELETEKGLVTSGEKLLGLDISHYPELSDMGSDMGVLEKLLAEQGLRMTMTNDEEGRDNGEEPSGELLEIQSHRPGEEPTKSTRQSRKPKKKKGLDVDESK